MSKLKELMKKKGYRIVDLAKSMELEPMYIHNWLKKYTPSAKHALRLMGLLDCEYEDLVHRKDK